MTADADPANPIRTAIDTVLERAVAEWRCGGRSAPTVVLVATLDDACLRIKAPVAVARARARALVDNGWTVVFCDLSGEPIAWNGDGRSRTAEERRGEATTPPAIAEDDLPPLRPITIDRLRDTA